MIAAPTLTPTHISDRVPKLFSAHVYRLGKRSTSFMRTQDKTMVLQQQCFYVTYKQGTEPIMNDLCAISAASPGPLLTQVERVIKGLSVQRSLNHCRTSSVD